MKKRFCVFALLLAVSVLFCACSLSDLIPRMNCTRTCYLPDGTIDYRYEYRYDENRKKTEQRRYDSKDNLVSINKYEKE